MTNDLNTTGRAVWWLSSPYNVFGLLRLSLQSFGFMLWASDALFSQYQTEDLHQNRWLKISDVEYHIQFFLCVLLISQCYGSYKQTNNLFVPLIFLYSSAHRTIEIQEMRQTSLMGSLIQTWRGKVSLTHNKLVWDLQYGGTWIPWCVMHSTLPFCVRKAVVGHGPKHRPLSAHCENTKIFCCKGLWWGRTAIQTIYRNFTYVSTLIGNCRNTICLQYRALEYINML